MRNIIIIWHSSAHNQSGQGRRHICLTNVCVYSKTSTDAFLYKAECSTQIRSILMAQFLAVLEWAEHSSLSTSPDFIAQTDASGSWGCTAVLDSQWLQWYWPLEWMSEGIMAKELIPMIFACIAWEMQLFKHHINFQCDNASLIAVINKDSTKDKLVVHLLCCCLWIFSTLRHLSYSHTIVRCNNRNSRSLKKQAWLISLHKPCKQVSTYHIPTCFPLRLRLGICPFPLVVSRNVVMHS